jgi:hypothetical protein
MPPGFRGFKGDAPVEKLDKRQVVEIAEGLRLIEEGVEKIQSTMREINAKSLRDVAEQLIPIFKEDDDSLSDSIIKHIG